MDSTIQTQSQLASVGQFNCQNCGAAHEVMNPKAKFVACQYCGSVLEANTEAHKVLTELGKPEKHRPQSFIRIGQTAILDGIEYQVISRTRWRMTYHEYWSEEGESGYSNEVWIYDEWLLIDAARTYFYLIEDKEGFWISEEIIPETPMLMPKNKRMSFYKSQSDQIVREYGSAVVVHFEGESNYQIKKGDSINFAMYKYRGIDYSAEWRKGNKGKEIKEIEFFKETPVSRRKLLEAFGDNEEIGKLRDKEAAWRFVYRVALMACLAMIGGIIYSLVNGGEPVFNQTISLNQLSETKGTISEQINLPEKDIYRLSLDVGFKYENSETYVFAYLMDGEANPLDNLGGYYYFWAGVEDGERWTESDMSSSKIFKADSQMTLTTHLYTSDEFEADGEVVVQVHKGILLTRYFVFALIISVIVLIIARSRFKT